MSGYDVSSFTDPCLAYQHINEKRNQYALIIIDDKMHDIEWIISWYETIRNKSKTKCNHNE
jgi:hypothetical protein